MSVTEIRGEEEDIPGRKREGWGEDEGKGGESIEDTHGEKAHNTAE